MNYSEIRKAATELFLGCECVGADEAAPVTEDEVLTHAEVCLGVIEAGWAFEYSERGNAAEHLSALTRRSPAVLRLVMIRARGYAETLKEYDASPWTPNAITVLANGPRCPELRECLQQLSQQYPGMASADLRDALLSMEGMSA
jgi:hypothetical protein